MPLATHTFVCANTSTSEEPLSPQRGKAPRIFTSQLETGEEPEGHTRVLNAHTPSNTDQLTRPTQLPAQDPIPPAPQQTYHKISEARFR